MGTTPRRILVSTVLVLIAVSLTACPGPVKQVKFDEWQEATRTLADGADAAADEAARLPRERAMREAVDDPTRITGMLLQRDQSDSFSWADADANNPAPLYLKAERFAHGVKEMNAAMREYANTLAALASSELIDREKLDELAEELNGHAVSAYRAFKNNQAATAPASEIALFTTAARAAAELYLQRRQREELQKIMAANQPSVQSLATAGVDAVALMTDEMWNEYQHETGRIARQAAAGGPDNHRAAVEALDRHNREHLLRLQTLRELREAYLRLPTAHAEIRQSLTDTTIDLDDVERLIEHGLALRATYEQLKAAATQPASTQPAN